MLKLLFIGDIVGSPGRSFVVERLPEIRKELEVDLVVANAENSAGGAGLCPDHPVFDPSRGAFVGRVF